MALWSGYHGNLWYLPQVHPLLSAIAMGTVNTVLLLFTDHCVPAKLSQELR